MKKFTYFSFYLQNWMINKLLKKHSEKMEGIFDTNGELYYNKTQLEDMQ